MEYCGGGDLFDNITSRTKDKFTEKKVAEIMK
jgi:hypothetical protein